MLVSSRIAKHKHMDTLNVIVMTLELPMQLPSQHVAASTRKTGNHVCRPDVCHKGRLGKQGFCRMLYWHWGKHTNEKKAIVAKRSHGLTLCPRWNGSAAPPVHTAPPLFGSPALETTHPFHFKMNPAMLLGP